MPLTKIEGTRHVYYAKSEWIALILSFVIPGLGQLYVGKIRTGIGMIALNVLLNVTMWAGMYGVETLPRVEWWDILAVICFILVVCAAVFWIVLWIYSMYHAYNDAKYYNRYMTAHDGERPW